MSEPHRRAGLNEMLAVVSAIAEAERSTQRVVQREFNIPPDADRVRRCEVLEDIGDLIARIIPVKDKVAPILRTVAIRKFRHDPGEDPPPTPDPEVDGEAESSEE